MTNFPNIDNRNGRRTRHATAILLSAAMGACSVGSDLAGNGLDGHAAVSVTDLSAPLGALEPDYTPEELEELAMSPAVQAELTPFQNAPAADRQLHVTMSDGVRIALSLYFPAGLDQTTRSAPTVYSETWYTRAKEAEGAAIDRYRAAGFVVAIADPRGFGASFGSQTAYLTDRQRADTAEVIGWLASQPWSNGKVATIGVSVSAMLAEAMLAGNAPELKAGIVRATEFDQYAGNVFPGGIPNARIQELIEFVYTWMRGAECVADLAACAQSGIGSVDGDGSLELLQAALRDHAGNVASDALASVVYRDDRVGSGGFDDVSPQGHVAALRRNALPARVSASWLDGTTAMGALARYAALPNVPMELAIGATTHLGGLDADPFSREAFTSARPTADVQFGADVAFVQRALANEAIGRKVDYYVLGAGVWKTTEQWPPLGVIDETWHLSRTRLVRSAYGHAGERRYQVDPTSSSGPLYNRWASQENGAVYYGDRRFAPGQRLAFDAPALRADSELVGAPELCLSLRSDQTDGIVIAYLEDVAPDGRVTYLTEGELRLLHRQTKTGGCDPAPGTDRSFERAAGAPVIPGELMDVEIPFLPVAARIEKGHHLRLSLAGADDGTFPMLSEAPALWTVAYGGRHGSTLRLPVKPWSPDR